MSTDKARKVEQAREVLEVLGFPLAQQNERSALVLLCLLDLSPGRSWARADGRRRWRTFELMQWLRDQYEKDYKPNSRETIRRQTLHQFVDAGLVDYNPDDRARAVNSSHNCYQIAPAALELLQTYGQADFQRRLEAYLRTQPGLERANAQYRGKPSRTADARPHLDSRAMPVPTNIADHVGRTPMVELTRIAPEAGARVFAKLEMTNPGGSVKDRIGVAMIEAAEREGRIEPGRTTIVEATSGNTGIALAFVCAAKGYDLVLSLPQGMSREREGLLRLYGARFHITESMGGMNESVAAAKAMAAGSDVWLAEQFANPANPAAHYATTGPEIWGALDEAVDCLVCGVGTGGTVTGVGRYLKERNPQLHVVAVEPASSPVLSGGRPGPHRIQGIGAGFVPPVLDRELLDEVIPVSDEDAIDTARLAASREGVLAGLSCGAALWGALQVAARPEAKGWRIAVVLPDSGERYVSTPFFAPEQRAAPTR